MEPTPQLVDIVKQCDEVFTSIHGDTIKISKNPLWNLECKIMCSNPEFDRRIVKLFCKVRFFARLKKLNYDLKINKRQRNVRTFKQLAQFSN